MSFEEDDDLMDAELFQTILKSFISETKEALELASSRILELEQEPENQVKLQEIFRIFHNIKGNAKAVGFMDLSDFSHKVENLLGKARDGKLKLNQDMIDVLLAANDALGAALDKALNDEATDSVLNPVISCIDSIK